MPDEPVNSGRMETAAAEKVRKRKEIDGRRRTTLERSRTDEREWAGIRRREITKIEEEGRSEEMRLRGTQRGEFAKKEFSLPSGVRMLRF